jgi:hypothetical protein
MVRYWKYILLHLVLISVIAASKIDCAKNTYVSNVKSHLADTLLNNFLDLIVAAN